MSQIFRKGQLVSPQPLVDELTLKVTKLNLEQKEILKHTAKNGMFCGDSPDMTELCNLGFMEYAGKKSFVPDPYYRITTEGRKAAIMLLPDSF